MAGVRVGKKTKAVEAALNSLDHGLQIFARKILDRAFDDDFTQLTAKEQISIATQSYKNLKTWPKGGTLIKVWSREKLSTPTTVIDIVNNNVPFLVDSCLLALREHGVKIRFVAHPILSIDKNGKKFDLSEKASKGSIKVSHIHVQADFIDKSRIAALEAALKETITMVGQVVDGWKPMLEKLESVAVGYRDNPPPLPAVELSGAMSFIDWLADNNFTFLGMREYAFKADGDGGTLTPIAKSGMGILTNPKMHVLRRGSEYVELTPEVMEFLRLPKPLIVTKANIRSKVHRGVHMDYIGVKKFDAKGQLSGELRIVGLFTSSADAQPNRDVPLIRNKITNVLKSSGFDANSHSGKEILAVLENYPRSELFQIGEKTLGEFTMQIAELNERPRVRVLSRIDRFDRFVSVLIYLPRERYSTGVRKKLGDYLSDAYNGHVSAYYPEFPEGDMARVHFIIGRRGGETPKPDQVALEAKIDELSSNWEDGLHTIAGTQEVGRWANGFSGAYQHYFSPRTGLNDIAVLNTLGPDTKISAKLAPTKSSETGASLKVYSYGAPLALSARVPLLENLGFEVIDESTYDITEDNGTVSSLHHMHIVPHGGVALDLAKVGPTIEDAMLALWSGQAENDGYNGLTTLGNIAWRDVSVIRALGRYLQQVGIAYSQDYLWDTLNKYPDITNHLIKMFYARHDPTRQKKTNARDYDASHQIVMEALNDIASLDEDRIIRHFLNLVDSSLRTNFYQRTEEGDFRPAIAIKYDPAQVLDLPEPRPFREISVYSPRVEGVHLRGGMIARGGLRWSDRPQDFRTEILGLVKAQMVKNAVIVPGGAKGGFVPKQMPLNPSRDQFMEEGIACYKIFIGSLLDITDNLDGDKVIHPKNVVRLDGDDPYLVVAADKGTATFSDIANGISDERGFWLSDAFASGGSVGYDHKKMGITARGGWEAVKRHFREMNKDIQSEPFTAVGIGDMSGDVFGNGMLLSKQTKLIAAYDHRDIFIDPDPDPATTFVERKRLFDMGRSSWQDYNKKLISKGGGIFPRSEKSIKLSKAAQTAIGLDQSEATPFEIMKAILQSEAELLWFGGIGTYIRAGTENDAEVGDRANDAIRVTGSQVRAKVIGEGANLGTTHLGRLEFAANGGRINTDAIDNSAGVNSSDLEVNIKIALGTLIRGGSMTLAGRNKFLPKMTKEVADLCLRNNYLQTLSMSLSERKGMDEFPFLARLIQDLDAKGQLNREVEFLPDDAMLSERELAEKPILRPELAVLLAYAKNTLFDDLLASNVPDDPYLAKELFRYFPALLAKNHPETIENHRLRREVIATVMCNAMINFGGISYVRRIGDFSGSEPGHIAFAYAAARDSFVMEELNASIDKLDTKMNGDTQLALYQEVQTLLNNQTIWFLRNVSFDAGGLAPIVETYRTGVAEVLKLLPELMPDFVRESVHAQAQGFVDGGTPKKIAMRIAELSALTLASEVVLISTQTGKPIKECAIAFFGVLATFSLGRITEQSESIPMDDYFDRMALDRALANLMRAQRNLTVSVLSLSKGNPEVALAKWMDLRADDVTRTLGLVSGMIEGQLSVSRLSVAAGLLSDLEKN